MKTLIVPVSGGKDSQVVLALALTTDRPIVCVHQNTGWDHPLTYKHIQAMECFYGVKIEHTVNKWGGMLPWLKTSAYFPNSAARGCTQRLKQEPFAKWLMENGYTAENCEIWFGMGPTNRPHEMTNTAALRWKTTSRWEMLPASTMKGNASTWD